MSETNVVALQWAMHYLTYLDEGTLVEPVTVTELRQHLRVDDTIEADYLMRLARVARHVIERYTNRSWLEQVLEVACQIRRPILPLPLSFPLRNVEGVWYTEPDGTEQPLSPALYTLALGGVPVHIDLTGAPSSTHYRVRYRAGSVYVPPEDIRHAILIVAKWAFEQTDGVIPETRFLAQLGRGNQIPPMVALLCDPYRLETFSW